MKSDQSIDMLSDVQRQTVELINSLAEVQGMTYADITIERIKQVRRDAGMKPGSNTDVMKIKNKWAEIYGIDPNSVRVVTEVKEKLVKRVLESMDDELRQLYENKAEKIIKQSGEAQKNLEVELSQTRTELDTPKTTLATAQSRIIELQNQVEELLLEKDTLLEQKRELDKEASSLRVSVGSLEKRLVDKDKQVADLNKNFESLRSDMETQRQSQLTIIDERTTEAKRANKVVDEVRDKLARVEQQLNDAKQQVTAKDELVQQLKAENQRQQEEWQRQRQTQDTVLDELRNENHRLSESVIKLQTALEKEQSMRTEQSHGLIDKIEKLIVESQQDNNKKTKKAKA
jgi:chromosome segregation protein